MTKNHFIGESMEKGEPSYTVGGNANWLTTMESSMEIPLKSRNKTTVWPSNPTSGHIAWGKHNWKRHMYPNNNDHGIQSHHFMANRWRNSGRLYFFFGSKITADDDCSHEIKRHLLLRRKVMTNLGSILKSRDIALPTKVHLVKAMVFPVVMYGLIVGL